MTTLGDRVGVWLQAVQQRLGPPVRLALVAGGLMVAAGLVTAAPGWWGQALAELGRWLGRAWLSVLLIAAGVAVLTTVTAYQRRVAGTGLVRGPGRPAISGRLPLLNHVALLLGLAGMLAVGLGGLLWVALGRPPLAAAGSAAWTVTETFEAIKIVLGVVAGMGGVVALTVAYRKQHLGEAAEQREDTRLFTERFGRAADQLGSEQAAVRLAGVHAMAQLADDWAAERQTCIDVLCAYLRMPYTPPTDPPAEPDERLSAEQDEIARREALSARQEKQVRYIVIEIIAGHLRRRAQPGWQGHSFDLTGAVIDGGDFSFITVDADTVLSLSKATFSGGTVSFLGARFSGEVDFGDAMFCGGTVYFGSATFSGGEVRFYDARFCGGEVYFHRATFCGGGVYFDEAAFSGGEVGFNYATFSGGTVNFNYATFCGCEVYFDEAVFSGGTVGFDRATFSGGVVDLSDPVDWTVPPRGLDETPPGVRLPSAEHLAKIAKDPT